MFKWKSFIQTPGWALLTQYADYQKNQRIAELLHGSDGQVNVERTRGEAGGIDLFAKIPATEIARLEAEIEILSKQAENDDETGNDDETS